MTNEIIIGDCRETLKTIPAGSVHCCVTSPPYWGLRDYGTATWDGGDSACDHVMRTNKHGGSSNRPGLESQTYEYRDTCGKCGARRIDSQLGLERTPEEFVANMVAVFREVRRVLRDDGTCWVNLGDSYASNTSGGACPQGGESARPKIDATEYAARATPPGLKPKDLCGIPWRVAFALQADGWYLRQDIIWHKPNPMPESVTDRCTKSHEYIFLLSKSERYCFDAEAIKEKSVDPESLRGRGPRGEDKFVGQPMSETRSGFSKIAAGTIYAKRNKRSVWTVNPAPFKGAHFATYPPKLIEPCILAGCPVGGTVLDPFLGAGTTAVVAEKWGRNWIGCELNEAYADIARKRIAGSADHLFAEAHKP